MTKGGTQLRSGSVTHSLGQVEWRLERSGENGKIADTTEERGSKGGRKAVRAGPKFGEIFGLKGSCTQEGKGGEGGNGNFLEIIKSDFFPSENTRGNLFFLEKRYLLFFHIFRILLIKYIFSHTIKEEIMVF